MEEIGYGGNILGIIKKLYEDTRITGELGSIRTNQIKVTQGLKQGCSLSPILFDIYISKLTKKLENSGEGITLY